MEAGSPRQAAAASLREVMPDREREISLRAMNDNASDAALGGRVDQVEAAAFRRLVDHLRERSDVQNIDLMELAGFCRNCLSRWYREAAKDVGLDLSEAAARERVYGMPYEEWKQQHQAPRRG